MAVAEAVATRRSLRAFLDRPAPLETISFGAPVLLLCHFPKLMKEAQWSDVGMWLQTIMLLLRGEGLDSCPHEFMGLYGRTIKAHLGLPEDHMLFCGIAIGWRDPDAPVNGFPRDRVDLDEQAKFLGWA
jgi:nitroreductase